MYFVCCWYEFIWCCWRNRHFKSID